MANTKFTATRIERKALEKLRFLAETDNRSIPTTLAMLVDAEINRRLASNVIRVDELPHPAGATTVPVLYQAVD